MALWVSNSFQQLVIVMIGKWVTCSRGSWVEDVSNPPQYNATTCPFIEKEYNRQNNGCPDHNYLYYSWHPTSCDLPRR
ncbi:unnamed protein product [Camellia sinensis]